MMEEEQFFNPPMDCSVAYFWIINDKVDIETCKAQLRDMAAHGLKAVCLHPEPPEFRPVLMETRLDLPYLGKDYFKFIAEMVAECKRLGMHYWLYDEGGWPSGNACGQVMAADPEHFQQMCIAKGENGAYIRTLPAKMSDGRYGYPNLLTPGVAEKFIEITHGRHKAAVGAEFGRTLKYVFQDEACFCRNAWTADFAEVFKARKGYDIIPYLDSLLEEPKDGDAEDVVKARVDYQDVRSQLFAERFVIPIRDWCRKNKLLSGGHFGGEDDPRNNVLHGYGHIMRVLRGLDLPGVDVIWRQLFPGIRTHAFPKYASSIARQSGIDKALTETAAVFGNGLTPLQLKWLLEHQLVRGINTIVISCYEMSTKDHLLYVNPRPQCGPDDPLWPYSDLWHTYFARLCYILRQGKADCHVAMFYDVRSIWAGATRGADAAKMHEDVSEELLRQQVDFDFVDDDALASAKVFEDGLHVGAMVYDTLVVPKANMMDASAQKVVARFKSRGGRVLDETQLKDIRPLVDVEVEDEPELARQLRVTKRVWDGESVYFIVNESSESIGAKLHFEAEWGIPVQLDAMTGEAIYLDCQEDANKVEWLFEPFGSLLMMFENAEGLEDEDDDGEYEDEEDAVGDCGRQEELAEGWTLKPVTKYAISTNGVEHIDMSSTQPVSVSLGDWQSVLGIDFSGEAVYTNTFSCKKKQDVYLELGQVNYVCTVVVNGHEVERCCWAPYVCNIPASCIRKGENKLEIRVSNTLANAINAPGELETWKKLYPKQRDFYDSMERPMEVESLPSGLFGPVSIWK